MDFNGFFSKIKTNCPYVDKDLIEKAYFFAQKCHQGQKRKSGQDFLIHPLETALILSRLKLDSKTIAAGILHDTMDHSDISEQELLQKFGPEISFIVSALTKLENVKYKDSEKEREQESLRRFFLAMAQDIRVVMIFLADRLHNMRTIKYLEKERQERLARQTLDIHAPLANRLGLAGIQGELEDLAFPLVYPKDYQWLMDEVKDKYKERTQYINKIKDYLAVKLKKNNHININIDSIYARAKKHYSLWRKLKKYNMELNRIYDLVALRIIVKKVEECYQVLGIIHQLWRPLPGRIKDYIAMPKPNGYQSLHTTVFCEEGKIAEIQIRTNEMQEFAEFGIAAHWLYKEEKPPSGFGQYLKEKILGARAPAPSGNIKKEELEWLNKLGTWVKDFNEASDKEVVSAFQIDFFKDIIFVFTPKGDIIDLPHGSTPVDFAFRIHSDLGNQCSGVKVNGKMVKLDYKLNNHEIVEIIPDRNRKGPSLDWLKFAKTFQARHKIKSWHKKQEALEKTI